jgi:hypothetical protein
VSVAKHSRSRRIPAVTISDIGDGHIIGLQVTPKPT